MGLTLTYSMSTPTIVAIPVQIQDAHGTAAKLAEVLEGNEDDIYQANYEESLAKLYKAIRP